MKPLEYLTKPKPGKCKVRFCRKQPRNISTHLTSHQLCGHHHKMLWRFNNHLHAAFDSLRSSARKRRKPFTLTLEEFKMLVAPTRYLDDRGRERHCLHIDRIDVALGYVFANLQVITCSENVIKGNAERRQGYVDEKISGRKTEPEPEPDPF